ncbi:Sensor histidine kinase TodS, partial [termite gut metagenome]
MQRILFSILFFLFNFSLHGQIGTFYSTDRELSSSLINCIYQDRRNYIWIATEDGLNKYDGVRFTVYKNFPNDSTSIKNNYVRSLFEDSLGRFWIGCINGLHLFNRTTDNFTEIKLYNDTLQITPHITSIIESANHEIWITTSGQGVIRIKPNDKTCHTDATLSSRLSSIHLTCVFQDSKGIFWIASENQGLNMYNPQTDEVFLFKAPQAIGSDQISAICEDNSGNLFIGTLTNGLYKLNARTQTFENVPYIGKNVLFVKSLLFDKIKNRLLIGTDGQGMKVFNEKKQCLEDIQISSTPFDLSRMKVHAICQDKSGNIWMGLFQKGIFLTPGSPNNFNYWGFKSHSKNVIGSGCMMSLIKETNGTLWIGTDNDGIYKMDNKGNARHFSPSGHPNSVPNTVLSMIEEDAGNIWLGSYLKGLACMNKTTGYCTYYNNQIQLSDDHTARNKIFSLAKDKQHKLWIGTNGAGVYVFDLREKIYTQHYTNSAKEPHQLPNDWINCIMCDHNGIVWIGSYNGICSINPLTGKMENYTTNNHILPGNIVYCINEDHKGNIWIGTTEGLVCFDKNNRKSTIYTTANGLSSNVICGILEDETGNIWLSTHSGVSKLIPDKNKFITYYAFDGLQGNEFSMGAAFKANDGEMFFGGINGISSFYPSEIKDFRTPLSLYLTGLYILDKPVVSGQKSGKRTVFNKFISDADTIHLNYKDNMFALEFSTFEFGTPERVYYRYMLEGLNSQWVNTAQGINRINFTNISHGTYKLRIKALIYDNSSEEKEVTILISSPWYLTWWAKFTYILLFACLMGGIAKYMTEKIRHKNELMRREHAEQISEAKLQFFINISHEIRTPMTLIISPLEKLIAENQDEEKQKVYLLIYRNAQRILRLINQLMDIRKIDKGLMTVKFSETDMVAFIDDLMQTFTYQANKRNIKFTFSHTEKQLKTWIDLNNFDKVLVNIFSNAFKFTPDNGEITITLHTGKNNNKPNTPLSDFFEIIIADTGIGIEEDKIEKIFERFYQITNIESQSGIGTGIGLHVARSLVELQHGIIYARNRIDRQGSEFIIRLPLKSAHLKNTETEIKNKALIQLQQQIRNKSISMDTFTPFPKEQKPKTK